MSELIKLQFYRTRQNLSKALKDVSPKLFEIVPEGFNNNIHWQVGHILVTAELFLFNGQNNLPASYTDAFKSGSKPGNWTDEVLPSVEAMLELLDKQLERINDLPKEAFTKPLAEPFIGNKTTGELAAFGAFHEAMHLGQIQSLKRLVKAAQGTQVN